MDTETEEFTHLFPPISLSPAAINRLQREGEEDIEVRDIRNDIMLASLGVGLAILVLAVMNAFQPPYQGMSPGAWKGYQQMVKRQQADAKEKPIEIENLPRHLPPGSFGRTDD